MAIYQNVRQAALGERLQTVAPTSRVWPRLISSNASLNNQPVAAALERRLADHEQIVLEGPAGSGKTVLCLFLAVHGRKAQFAYLEAQRWAPTSSGDLLSDFLITAGCDHDAAVQALKRGELVLILDAIDEAPWRSGGANLSDVLAAVSEEIDGKAGLLVTSRTLETVPPLEASHATAALGGIHLDDLEAFLGQYEGNRAKVSELVQSLRSMPFRESIKYSPLILRRLAEGLSFKGPLKNLAELFEQMADFHVTRECSKPVIISTPGSWQAAYAQEQKHRNLVNALVFGSPREGHKISEEEFRRVVEEILRPDFLGARALVEISTLMADHPLVTVRYRPDEMGRDAYLATPSHDWVRTALFPKFFTEDCFDAQVHVSDVWHKGLPHPEDFVPAWDYLGTRCLQTLDAMLNLVSSAAQTESICRWLLAQLFSVEGTADTKSRLFAALARAAYTVVPRHSNIMDYLDSEDILTGPLLLDRTSVSLDRPDQCGNMSGVTFDSVEILLDTDGPDNLALWNCRLRQSKLIVRNAASITLAGSFLESLEIVIEGTAAVALDGCTFDPRACVFPDQVRVLESCVRADVAGALHRSYALVEVLRRLVVGVNPARPELTRKRANIGEHNIYKGVVRDLSSIAEQIVETMVQLGFVVRKPTGGVKRIDPTTLFDACEAAQFITRPNIGGRGPMTKAIMLKLANVM